MHVFVFFNLHVMWVHCKVYIKEVSIMALQLYALYSVNSCMPCLKWFLFYKHGFNCELSVDVYKKDENSTTLLLVITCNSYLARLIPHCYNEQTKMPPYTFNTNWPDLSLQRGNPEFLTPHHKVLPKTFIKGGGKNEKLKGLGSWSCYVTIDRLSIECQCKVNIHVVLIDVLMEC